MKKITLFVKNLFLGTKRSVQGASAFVLESREEFKKVTWPTREEVTNFTLVVIVSVVILSLFLWIIDLGLLELIKMVMK